MVLSDEITVQPFGTKVRVLIGETIREALEYWEENLTPTHNLDIDRYSDADGIVIRIVHEGLFHYGIVLAEDAPDSSIVHETFHLVMKIADHKGASWSEDSDEWYAYCQGLMYDDIMSLLIHYRVDKEKTEGI